ncbi:unnamed protein product, partial [Amoebophrya sp. A25]
SSSRKRGGKGQRGEASGSGQPSSEDVSTSRGVAVCMMCFEKRANEEGAGTGRRMLGGGSSSSKQAAGVSKAAVGSIVQNRGNLSGAAPKSKSKAKAKPSFGAAKKTVDTMGLNYNDLF